VEPEKGLTAFARVCLLPFAFQVYNPRRCLEVFMDAPLAGMAKSAFLGSAAGSDVERRLAALENAFKIASDGSITIQCKQLQIKTIGSVAIESGTSMIFKGGSNVDLMGSILVRLRASSVEIEAPGSVSIKGATVKLNIGGKPVARVGDTVQNGVIVVGTPTVLA